MDIEIVAGVIFVILAVVMAAFQIALGLGAPWGAAAYGGSNPGVLPTRMRVVSAIAGFGVYPFIALFVADAAGVVDTGLADGGLTRVWLWVLAGLLAIGAVMNFASRSKIERVWGPVTLVMCACCIVLAIAI